MRILVTRTSAQSQKTAVKLEKFGHECVIAPLVEVEYQNDEQIQTNELAGIAVTSGRAIEGLQQLSNFSKFTKKPLYCVGDNTATIGKDVGFQTVYSAQGEVTALSELIQSKYVVNSGSILYPTSVNRIGDLEKKLLQAGIPTKLKIIYKTHYLQEFPAKVASEIENGNIEAILIFSKNGCTALINCLKTLNQNKISQIRFYAISENAAIPLNKLGSLKVIWPSKPNEESLLQLLSN